MFVSLQKILFFLIIFCLSFQVGYHFWPNFAYVSGLRIDYLSPTLYLLDILIILYILLSFPIIIKQKIKFPKDKILLGAIILFLISLIVSSFIAKDVSVHLFGLAKLIEFFLFAFCVARTFSAKEIKPYIYILCISALISSGLAIWQLANQGSIGGILYFVGERTFSLSTIGISTVNIGQQVLRPYASFPHPNVLGFFLLMTIVFAAKQVFIEKGFQKLFLISSVIICELALLLTFSRIDIILSTLFFVWLLVATVNKNTRKYSLATVGILIILIVISFPQIINQYFLFRGIDFREELLVQSWTILQKSPIFGIGINNFYINQLPLIRHVSPTNFQPPHNIFVLWLLQFGVAGFLILLYIFYDAFKSVLSKIQKTKDEMQSFYQGIFFLLIAIIIAGMFDHYFLTVEQGQIMLALILGLSFTSFKKAKK